MKQKTILVTGGCGFIGSNFIRYWMDQHPDDHIINLDALTYAGNLENLKDLATTSNYSFVEGSITNPEIVDSCMKDADIVVHFAAETHVDRSISNPSIFVTTNVLGTQVLLDKALEHGIERFHHISTDEVFGSLELNSNTFFDETTSYDPRSPYSASKAGSDHLVRAYGETYNLPFTLTNCSNNYGPYHFPEKFIPLAITNLMEGKNVPIYGDGLNVRDWLFVEDHCSAIELVLLEGIVGETYLVGGMKQDVSNKQIIEMILSIMGESTAKIEYVADRAGHDRRYAVNWSKIETKLGWKPRVTLEEGLAKTVQWYQQNQDWWQPLKENNATYFATHYAK